MDSDCHLHEMVEELLHEHDHRFDEYHLMKNPERMR
jgi:hypothetical protein